jgi:uncharacterized membrane protein YukC
MSQEFELFKGTNFSDLMRDVYPNSKDDEGNEFGLSDDERKRLLEEAENEIENIKEKNTEVVDGSRNSGGDRDKEGL